MEINEFFEKTFTKDFIEEANAQYELTRQGAIMTDKKMNKDEAEKLMEKCRDSLEMRTYFRTEGDEVQLCEYSSFGKVVARFPFEPPHPEKGTLCRLWNSNKDVFVIAKLSDVDLDEEPRYRVTNVGWFQHAEPFKLIDPGDHDKLSENFDELLDQHKEVCAECDKAKQDSAVLAELLPVCEEIVHRFEIGIRNSPPITKLINLLKQTSS